MKIEIRSPRPTTTGVDGGVDADVVVTRKGGKVLAEITVVFEEWNHAWAPYGNSPDHWLSDPHLFTQDEMRDLIAEIRAFDFAEG